MKTILITGAATGFGRELALKLASKDYRVLATMRNSQQRQVDFPKHDNITFLELDINSKDDRNNLKNFIEQKLDGKLDVLVNNAGYGAYGALEDASDEFISSQIQTNLTSQAILTKDLLPYIRKQKGEIYFMTSIMGRIGMPLSSLYCASKFGLEGLAESLSYELAPHGVKVMAIAPGRHRTQFAQNIQWANREQKNSAYQRQYHGLQNLMNRMMSKRPVPQQNVVSTVMAEIERPSSRISLLVGSDAKFLAIIKKIFPLFIYQRFMSLFYKKGLQL